MEVVIALGVIAVAFGTIGIFASRVTAAAHASRQDLIAGQLAMEGVEIMRNLRETNWIRGNTNDASDDNVFVTGEWRDGLLSCAGSCGYLVTANPEGALPVITRYDNLLSGAVPLMRLGADGTYRCDSSLPTPTCGTLGTPTPYRRYVQILPAPDDKTMDIVSTVLWCPTVTANCDSQRSVVVVDRLRNWIPR